jgi:molecular chaperone GrpE
MSDEQTTETKQQTAEAAVSDAIDFDAEDGDGGRLAQLEKELEEVRQHVLYAQAETQNVRRRLEQEKQAASAYAATAFARDMLSVKDNLERALSVIPEDLRGDERMKGLITGIEATGRELTNVFQRHGITRIDAMGQPLDPNKHQAMLKSPARRPSPAPSSRRCSPAT